MTLHTYKETCTYGRCGCDDCADFVHGTDAVAIAVQLLHEKIPGYEVTYR